MFKESYVQEAQDKGFEIVAQVSSDRFIYKRIKCGHLSEINVNNMRHQKRVLCKECDEIAFNTQIKIKGLTLVERSGSSKIPDKYIVNACGHETTILKGNLFKANSLFKCEKCTEEKFNKALEDKGFEVIEYTASSGAESYSEPSKVGKFRFKTCGHEFLSVRSHIYKSSTRCYICNPAKPQFVTSEEQQADFTLPLNPTHIEEGLEKGLKLLSRSTNRCYGYYERIECRHKMFLHYGAIRKTKTGDFKCQECFNEKVTSEAKPLGLEFIEKISVSSDKGIYRVKDCGHILELRIGNVRLCKEDKWTCSKCREIQHEEEVKRIGAIHHKDIEPDRAGRRYYTLSCGHTKWLSLRSVRENSYRCIPCQDNRYSEEAEKVGIVYNRHIKPSHHNFRSYTLPCGCIKEITPNCVILGAFECKTHPNRKIDFTRPIYVYLIKLTLPIGDILKVGFAADLYGVMSRYSRYGINKENVTPIYEVLFNHGEEAVKFEKYIHKQYKDSKFDKQVLKEYLENGFTECYPIDSLEILVQEFSKFDNQLLKGNFNAE